MKLDIFTRFSIGMLPQYRTFLYSTLSILRRKRLRRVLHELVKFETSRVLE